MFFNFFTEKIICIRGKNPNCIKENTVNKTIPLEGMSIYKFAYDCLYSQRGCNSMHACRKYINWAYLFPYIFANITPSSFLASDRGKMVTPCFIFYIHYSFCKIKSLPMKNWFLSFSFISFACFSNGCWSFSYWFVIVLHKYIVSRLSWMWQILSQFVFLLLTLWDALPCRKLHSLYNPIYTSFPFCL